MHVSQEHERILSRPAVFRCGQRPTNLAKHTRMAKRVWWPVILCKIESLKLSVSEASRQIQAFVEQ